MMWRCDKYSNDGQLAIGDTHVILKRSNYSSNEFLSFISTENSFKLRKRKGKARRKDEILMKWEKRKYIKCDRTKCTDSNNDRANTVEMAFMLVYFPDIKIHRCKLSRATVEEWKKTQRGFSFYFSFSSFSFVEFLFHCSVCFFFVFIFSCCFDTIDALPEICEKHCVNVVTTNPDANAVASSTDDTDAPTPAPAAAPHTMNTYKNDAKHSAMIDLKSETKRKKERKEKKREKKHKYYFGLGRCRNIFFLKNFLSMINAFGN